MLGELFVAHSGFQITRKLNIAFSVCITAMIDGLEVKLCIGARRDESKKGQGIEFHSAFVLSRKKFRFRRVTGD